MISVVVPLYNKADYIAETLRSVCEQSYGEFELIVVDDGSTDGSNEIVASIDDDRLQLIGIANSGVSVARNTGIEAARHPWIAFLDGDDWWAPDFLKEIKESIDTHSGYSIFTTNRSRVFKDTIEPYHNRFIPSEGETAFVHYCEVIGTDFPPINSSDVVIRKTLFSEVGKFHPGMKMHEDHDLWLRLCANNPIVYINKDLSFYRKTERNSASSQTFNASDFLRYIDTLTRVKAEIKKHRESFQLYADRFLLQCYLKYKGDYTKEEREKILKRVKALMSKGAQRKLSILNHLPVKQMYNAIKKMKS